MSQAEYNYAVSQLSFYSQRYNDLSQDITVLKSAHSQLKTIRDKIKTDFNDLKTNSQVTITDWHGDTTNRYRHQYRVNISQSFTTYIGQIDSAITEMNNALTDLKADLSSAYSAKSNWQSIVNKGVLP